MRVLRHWAIESAAGSALITVALALVLLYGLFAASTPTKDDILVFFISVVLVVGLQIFSGNTGILSFGHMAFIGSAAYVAGLLTLDPLLKPFVSPGLPQYLETTSVSFLPATLIAVGVAGVLALVSGLFVLRLDGASAVIAILSLLLIAFVVFNGWTSVTRGAGGVYGMPRATTLGWAFAWAVVAVFVARWFKDSSTGLQLQASREDAFSAASVGVRVRALRMRAWILSAMVSAAGGALLALYLTAITPSTFYLARTFTIIVMLIVGGMATVTGAVVGTGLVTLVQEIMRPWERESLDLGVLAFDRLTGLTEIALALLILLVMYFRREGLIGRRELDEALRGLVRRS
jgi:branched-chain amino acid transport system permease protein